MTTREAVRDEFEKWAASKGLDLRNEPSCKVEQPWYSLDRTRWCWNAWQAAILAARVEHFYCGPCADKRKSASEAK